VKVTTLAFGTQFSFKKTRTMGQPGGKRIITHFDTIPQCDEQTNE